MSSWFTGWHPIKALPDYQGGYEVGTVDVEIPAYDVPAPSDAPEGAQPTVAFRIFYPCVKPDSHEADRPVRWIPQPQRATIAAMAKFLGVKDRTASLISYLPQQLYWIKLPAHRNARLLEPPTSNGRWPVTFFSHGLAGSRNAYSQICGDLASHGMIVIALDHRDGSSPIQYVRATTNSKAHIVEPVKIPHLPITDEIYQARDKQLRIRTWEMCMVYEALIKIDAGHELENLDSNTSHNHRERVEVLWQFNDMLDIHRPGKVSWAGHSFGAATTVQLLKEIHYHKERTSEHGFALLKPKADAAIVGQIMPDSPMLLLDMWCLPLQSPQQNFLWEKPLPTYTNGGPNGANVLSVLSEAFQNWEENLNINKHIVAAPSQSRTPSVAPRLTREKGQLLPTWAQLRSPSPSSDSGYASENSRGGNGLRRYTSGRSRAFSNLSSPEGTTTDRTQGPHMFYAQMSQHFSQSDFGVLFPWIAKRVTKAEEPELILALNIRAMTQVIRESGIEIAGESDEEILAKEPCVRRWLPITIGESQATTEPALKEVQRRLSLSSAKSPGSPRTPRDGMTLGISELGHLEGMAPLEMPPPMKA